MRCIPFGCRCKSFLFRFIPTGQRIQIVRDNEVHRREYVANGSPDAVWNQRIWIKPDAYSMRGMAQNLF